MIHQQITNSTHDTHISQIAATNMSTESEKASFLRVLIISDQTDVLPGVLSDTGLYRVIDTIREEENIGKSVRLDALVVF